MVLNFLLFNDFSSELWHFPPFVRWSALRDVAEKKKDDINSGHGVQTFHIECKETIVRNNFFILICISS